jgi:hypothetical protein
MWGAAAYALKLFLEHPQDEEHDERRDRDEKIERELHA